MAPRKRRSKGKYRILAAASGIRILRPKLTKGNGGEAQDEENEHQDSAGSPPAKKRRTRRLIRHLDEYDEDKGREGSQ
jgi:hypothetical protein